MWRRRPSELPFVAFAVLAVAGAAACTTDAPFIGDESMGVFSFTASIPATQTVDGGTVATDVPLGDPACPFEEIERRGFTFEGQFSRWQDGRVLEGAELPAAYFMLRGITREGTWDGQVFQSTYTAPRRFETTACPAEFEVDETMTVVLLSESQSRALGDQCPAQILPLLDGGTPVDPDAGITAPTTRENGFDAIRACGVLTDVIRSSSGCNFVEDAGSPPGPASFCVVRYRLDGVRKQ